MLFVMAPGGGEGERVRIYPKKKVSDALTRPEFPPKARGWK